MAPAVSAPAPAHAQPQSRRPMRIVPAVPLRLSRAPRPVTPEDSGKDVQVAPQISLSSRPPGESQSPLTPDSRASRAEDGIEDAVVLPTSPVYSQRGEAGRNHSDSIDPQSAVPTEPKITSNGTYRKLTIPSQLPPPFYPASKPESHTPPANGSNKGNTQHHRPQLSATAEAFHSAGGSPAVPTTPKDLDHEASDPQNILPPGPRPGLAAPPFTPPFLANHTQRPSDTTALWPIPHVPAFSTDPSNGHGPSLHPPAFTAGPEVYLSPFNGHFPRDQASFVSNCAGASRSSSPDKSLQGGGDDVGGDFHTVPHRNGTTAHFEPPDGSPIALAAYLSTQFANPEFADLLLQIHAPKSVHVSLPAHGIVVVRSPIIAKSMHRSAPPSHRPRDARRIVDIVLSEPFLTRESLEEAVRVLYGAPLLSPRNFLYGVPPYGDEAGRTPSSDECRRRMQQLLSYISAGRALQIPIMGTRGVDIARSLIRWDTVDLALRFGLQSSAGRSNGLNLEDPFMAAILEQAIEYIAFSFPVDFKLYTLAPEIKDMERIPIATEFRPPTHNPRLSKIRFGDAPPEEMLQPTHATHILSSILLTIPLPLVDRLLNHRATANQIGWTGAVRFMRDVIEERESRRQKALKSYVRSSKDGQMSKSLEDILYAEEYVQETEVSTVHPSGYKLATNYVITQV